MKYHSSSDKIFSFNYCYMIEQTKQFEHHRWPASIHALQAQNDYLSHSLMLYYKGGRI